MALTWNTRQGIIACRWAFPQAAHPLQARRAVEDRREGTIRVSPCVLLPRALIAI